MYHNELNPYIYELKLRKFNDNDIRKIILDNRRVGVDTLINIILRNALSEQEKIKLVDFINIERKALRAGKQRL